MDFIGCIQSLQLRENEILERVKSLNIPEKMSAWESLLNDTSSNTIKQLLVEKITIGKNAWWTVEEIGQIHGNSIHATAFLIRDNFKAKKG